MKSQQGSTAKETIKLKKNKENEVLLKLLIKELLNQGYIWYKDFYIDWMQSPLLFEIYDARMIEYIKNYIFENSIGEDNNQ